MISDQFDLPTGKLKTRVAIGKQSKQITGCVDKNDIDLIIMSTRGRSGVSRMFMGSVAESVLHLSKVPVLTIRATENKN